MEISGKISDEVQKLAYVDLVQPSAREIGTTLGRAVHVILLPASGIIWGVERISEYLSTRVGEILEQRGVPEERLAPPDIAVVGPAIEAMRFARDKPSLREMYASLLASAVDSETASKVHPSFVNIIGEISPLEAWIIQHLGTNPTYQHGRLARPIYHVILPDGQSRSDPGLPIAIDNLARLRLVSFPTKPERTGFDFHTAGEGQFFYEPAEWDTDGHYIDFRLTALGNAFRSVCLTDEEASIE